MVIRDIFNKRNVTIGLITTLLLIILIDTSIAKTYYISFNQMVSLDLKLIIFFLLGLGGFVCQFILIRFLKNMIFDNSSRRMVKFVYFILYYYQFVLILVYSILILELEINNKYHTGILIFIIISVTTISSLILISLSRIFIKWYIHDRNHVLFIYGVSFISLSLSIIFASTISSLFLFNKPEIIYMHHGIVSPYYHENVIDFLENIYSVSSIFGFVLAWIAILFMLYQYSIKWKRKFHWIIMCIPMVYFFIQFTPMVEYFFTIANLPYISYGILYSLFIEYNQLIGGLIFGAAFWTLSKNLYAKGVKIRMLNFSGYGFLILFITNQSIILSPANFPPFGVITVCMLSFASGILFLGVFSSALRVSFDNKIKDALRKLVDKKSNMLLSMSTYEAITSLESNITEIYDQIAGESSHRGLNTNISIEEAKDFINKELADMIYLMKKDEVKMKD